MKSHGEIIFVYGTLRRGGSNHYRLDGSVPLGAGTVRGRLFRVDWYPALLLDEAGREIIGEAHAVDPGMLAALDEFEGEVYQRVRVKVNRGDDEPPLEAWIWEYIASVDGLKEISSGDWLEEYPQGSS